MGGESEFLVQMAGPGIYSVLGGYLHILGAPTVQSCCILLISASYRVFVYGRYRES